MPQIGFCLPMLAALLLTLAPAPQGPPWAEAFLRAETDLASGQLAAARSGFELSLSATPEHLPSVWGLACVAAREGRMDEALHHLERVEQGGGAEPALLRWDPDLAALREESRFERLARRWEEDFQPAKRCVPKIALPGGSWFQLQSADALRWQDFANLYETLGRVRGKRASFIGGDPVRVVSIQQSRAILQDAATGEVLATFDGPGAIRSHGLTGDGERLLLARSGRADSKNRLLNSCDLREVRTGRAVDHRVPPADEFVLSPAGNLVLRIERLGDGFRQLSLWGVGHRAEPRFEITRPACSSRGIGFLPDLNVFAVLGESGTITIYSMDSGRTLHQFETGASARAQLRANSREGTLLCFDSRDETCAFQLTNSKGDWTHELLWCREETGKTRSLHLQGSQFVRELASGGFVLHDLRTGMVLNRVAGKKLWKNSSWRPHPKDPVLWGLDGVGSFVCLDGASGRVIKSIAVEGRPQHGFEFSRRGRYARALDEDQRLHVVDLEEETSTVLDLKEHGPLSGSFRSAFSPDEESMLVRASDLELQWVSLPEGEVLARIELAEAPRDLAWKDDGSEFAVLDIEGGVWRALLDRSAGAILASAVELDGTPLSIAYEPLRERLWVGCEGDRAIAFENGEETRRFEFHRRDNFGETIGANRLLFDPFGRRAYLSSKGQQYIVAFDPENAKELWSRRFGHYIGAAPRLSLDRLGKRLSLSSGRRMPYVVDAETGKDFVPWDARFLNHCRPVEGTDLFATSSWGYLRVFKGLAEVERWQRFDYGERGALLRAPSGHVAASLEVLAAVGLEVAGRPVQLQDVAHSVLDPKRVRASIAGVMLDPPDLSAAIAFDEMSWLRLAIEGVRAFEVNDMRLAEDLLRCSLRLRPRHAPQAYSLARVMSARSDKNSTHEWLTRCAEWGGKDSYLYGADFRGGWLHPKTAPLALEEAWSRARERRLENPPALDLSMAAAPFIDAPKLSWWGDAERGNLIAATGGGELLRLELKTGRVTRRLRVSGSALSEPRFSPDGAHLATVDEEGLLTLVTADLAWIRGTFAMPPGAEFTFANNGALLLVQAAKPLVVRTRDMNLAPRLTELAHWALNTDGPPETLVGQRAFIDLTYGGIQTIPWGDVHRATTPLEVSGGRWDRYDFEDGNWILRTAPGHVDGTFEAFTRIQVETEAGVRSLLELAPELYDPNQVCGYIAGTAISATPSSEDR